jgi:hypothetical protein
MEYFDVKAVKGFSITPNYHQHDRTLSAKAKGILSLMFSLPDDWDYTLKGLAYLFTDGIDSIRSGVRELERAGYIVRSRMRDDQGRLRGTKYTVYPIPHLPKLETPALENPMQGEPTQDQPAQVNPTQLNIDITNTDQSITDLSNIHSFSSEGRMPPSIKPEEKRNETRSTEVERCREIIKENICYEYLLQDMPQNKDRVDEMLELIVETVCCTKKYIRVAGADYPAEVVRSRFLKLDMEHIKFVFDCLKENTTKIRNIKQYLLTTLYNAPMTIGNYYAALVQHDLYQESSHDRNS